MSSLSFEYIAVGRDGASRRGTLSAPSRQDAYRRLAADGMTPTKLREAKASRSLGSLLGSRIKAEEVAHFTYQLSVLLEARIPIVSAMQSIAEQETNPALSAVCNDLAREVQAGRSITDAMLRHQSIFGTVYIETVRAAEASGNIISVLAHLAESVEEQGEMRRLIRGAALYPAAVLVTLTIATLFLVTFVVPKFANMFAARGIDLPLLTVVLMLVGDSIRAWWYAYLGGMLGLVLILRGSWKRESFRRQVDTLLHRVPYLRDILVGIAIARFSGVLSIALRSGLGLIDCITMAGNATGRPLLQADMNRLADQVRRGGRLREILPDCAYLTGFTKQLLSAGEEAAEIPKMCDILSRHYARETRHKAKNLSTVVEPVLIAVLTVVVLVIALAIFLPMWDMVSIMG
ncbi:MAG: type II secretion system F family protein [Phycisphaerales bacterium]